MADNIEQVGGRYLTVSSRVRTEVYAFLRQNCVQGKCAISVAQIAQNLGFANATAHRAIKRLEADGLIRVEAPAHPTLPSVIHLLGEPSPAEVVAQGQEHLSILRNTVVQFETDLVAILGELEYYEAIVRRHQGLVNSFTSVTKLDEGLYHIIVRADGPTAEWLDEIQALPK